MGNGASASFMNFLDSFIGHRIPWVNSIIWLTKNIGLIYYVHVEMKCHRTGSFDYHGLSSMPTLISLLPLWCVGWNHLAIPKRFGNAWWRHQMETCSALLAICAGNSPVPGEFPAQRPVTRSFDVFFDLRLNKRLSKQSWGWWFETLSRPIWRHRNWLYNFTPRTLPWTCYYWSVLGLKLIQVSIRGP